MPLYPEGSAECDVTKIRGLKNTPAIVYFNEFKNLVKKKGRTSFKKKPAA